MLRRILPMPPLLVLAACATGSPAASSGQPAGIAAEAPTGRAAVKLVAPKAAYQLAEDPAPGVHRWVASDMLAYSVELKSQTGPGAFEHTVTSVEVPVKGEDAKTSAVFTKLPWGTVYRAYITALGNEGGVVSGDIASSTLTPMNTPAATTDFDFSTPGTRGATLTQPVTVAFDVVPFAGNGTVTFASPGDGGYTNPGSTAVTGEAE